MRFKDVTTSAAVSAYEAGYRVFAGLLAEMRELSKKKPDATLSKKKVRMLNRVLEDLRAFLSVEPEGKYLDLLEDEDLPQNSDAVLIMVQYGKALQAFKGRYCKPLHDFGEPVWVTREFVASFENKAGEEEDEAD